MENNKLDQFYKDSLSGYEAGVSGSFWLRLKLRLLWLDTKFILFGVGALLLLGSGVFTGFYLIGNENNQSNETTALYQSRTPEAMAAMLVMNNTEIYSVQHTPITVEPVFAEDEKNAKDISVNVKQKPNRSKDKVSKKEMSFGSNSVKSSFSASTVFDSPKEKHHNQSTIDPLTGLNISIISEIEIVYDTVLSPYFIKQKKSWFSLTLYAAPAYTMAQMNSTTMDEEYMNYRKEHETATISWSAGLDVQLNFKNWYIQTGLAYSAFSSKRNYDHTFSTFDESKSFFVNDTSWGHIYDPPNIGEAVVIGIDSVYVPYYNEINNGTNDWKYLEIPLVAGYKFNLNRFSIDIGTGFSYGYLISVTGNVPSLVNENEFTELNDLESQMNQHQFNYILQLGLSYFITPKWSVVAQPYYKQNIQSVFNNSYPVEQRFRAVGIKFGFKINL